MKKILKVPYNPPYTWSMTERQEIRCAAHEKQAFKEAADRAKLSVSEWIRRQLVNAAAKSAKAKG